MGAAVHSGTARGMSAEVAMSLALLDWRRRVARLYAEVRAEPDVVAAHDHWRRTRDDLLRTHPESPVPEAQRAGYAGAPVAAYDSRLRFDVAFDAGVPPKHMEVPTGTDGVVAFDRIGCVHLPGVGDLRRGPVSHRHGQGRGPRRRRGTADPRLQLRLQPVLRVRPGLGVPAGPRGQHARAATACGRTHARAGDG